MTDIALGGRLFAPANFDRMTSLQECNVMRLLRASGLDRILPAQDTTEVEWLVKLNSAVMDCGKIHELIAAFLLPIGKTERDWTPDLARETKAFLEQLDTSEDRASIHHLGMEVAVGFFVHGLALLARSQNALTELERSAPQSLPKTPKPDPAAVLMPAPTPLVRTVARFDFPKSEEVARWPIRELLIAYLACLRERLLEQHRQEELVWAATAIHLEKRPPPPKLHDLLKNPRDEYT